ncbi:hypothetical protein LTR64_006227 [Lithohypha guttulata]|uniref:uncharacterized protein n=1 Tax=Lithohypha guttulata TaxID=1690604 RepID=UPI00315D9FE1
MAENTSTAVPEGDIADPRACHGVLLLPAIPLPTSPEQVREAYKDILTQTLKQLEQEFQTQSSSPILRLDIDLLFDGGSEVARTPLFPSLLGLFAELYTLVCICASQCSLDLDFPRGVDVRIYAIDAPHAEPRQLEDNNASHSQVSQNSATTTYGPLSTIEAFKSSRRTYLRTFVPGQQALRESTIARGWDKYLTGSSVQYINSSQQINAQTLYNTVSADSLGKKKLRLHTKVAVGGTFDHLHIGHKLLLTATIFIAQPGPESREITVGITGDELLVNKKHASVLESWDTRQEKVAAFVESILVFHSDIPSIRTIEHIDKPGPNGKVVKITYDPAVPGTGKVTINYVQISDPFGPTITDESITALVISAETRAGGKAVNDKRTDKGWAPLEVFEVDVLDPAAIEGGKAAEATNFATKISSTEIRRRLAAPTDRQLA